MENHSFYIVYTLDGSNSLSGLYRQRVFEKICLPINYKHVFPPNTCII